MAMPCAKGEMAVWRAIGGFGQGLARGLRPSRQTAHRAKRSETTHEVSLDHCRHRAGGPLLFDPRVKVIAPSTAENPMQVPMTGHPPGPTGIPEVVVFRSPSVI